MLLTKHLRKHLDYLIRSGKKSEETILADAIEVGLMELYRDEIEQEYLTGKRSRADAIRELGEETVRDLDEIREAVMLVALEARELEREEYEKNRI